jgi:phosphomannomutase/phosphomannomutase/phosphoglucomutase
MGEHLPAFKAYDIRGRVPDQLNEDLARQIGRATANVLDTRRVVVGRDMRLSSEPLAAALAEGFHDMGVDVVDIGLCGTENVYFVVSHLEEQGVGGGVMVTASHNPADYNGMKLVRHGARPISGDTGLRDIEAAAAAGVGAGRGGGKTEALDLWGPYADHLLTYVDADALSKLTLVGDPGNGCAGLAVDKIADRLPFEWHRVNWEADGTFPNGVPNPLLPENRAPTIEAVKQHKADLGVAWDGDFDRCFFFDEKGEFVEGYYVVGLFAEEMLRTHPGSAIIHDPRLRWNTEHLVEELGGRAVCTKTGHAFIKERMRKEDAVYGGEMSAHHYFRDFAYCDSGMIPWLLMTSVISRTGKPLSELLAVRQAAFPASGEINRRLDDADAAIERVRAKYEEGAEGKDETDGLSLDLGAWRMNLRKSNTEPLLRLNVESRGDEELMREMTEEVLAVIDGSPS